MLCELYLANRQPNIGLTAKICQDWTVQKSWNHGESGEANLYLIYKP